MLTEEEVGLITRLTAAAAKAYKAQHELEGRHDKTVGERDEAWGEFQNVQNELLRVARR